jgi:hypothetical protein
LERSNLDVEVIAALGSRDAKIVPDVYRGDWIVPIASLDRSNKL